MVGRLGVRYRTVRENAVPRSTGHVNLWVADASAPVWAAVGQIMATTPYYFNEGAGGTYNCRPIGGTKTMSIHAYALGSRFEPVEEPAQEPAHHGHALERSSPGWKGSEPQESKRSMWGGRWDRPDAMHWQINVAPEECETVTWDKGDDMAEGPERRTQLG